MYQASLMNSHFKPRNFTMEKEGESPGGILVKSFDNSEDQSPKASPDVPHQSRFNLIEMRGIEVEEDDDENNYTDKNL